MIASTQPKENPMGLFDTFKDKAAELVQGAKDQVSEFTGTEPTIDGLVGGASEHADQAAQAADDFSQEGQNLAENTETAAGDAVNKYLGE
jgi:hypothetical protein